MFCFKCGASMPEDSQACPKCAAPVQPVISPAQTRPGPDQAPSNQTAASSWLNAPAAPQQNYQQPQYPPQGQPNPYYAQYPQQTDSNAVVSMILGIVSFALCLGFLTGIPAVILGHISRSKIAKSGGRLKGDGMALAGLIMGYCSFVFILFFAAIFIPNIVRNKISANESAAASTVRTVNTAQVTYETAYPSRGYAANLATLGPGSSISCSAGPTADHACLLDGTLGAPRCTSGVWCQKYQFKFTMTATCSAADSPTPENPGECKDYVVVATPVSSSTGLHSYCSTTDAVVRIRSGPIVRPPTAEECGEWPPLS